jgi:hypothetical protein
MGYFFKPVFQKFTKYQNKEIQKKGAFLKIGSRLGFIVNGLKPYKLWH